MNHPTQRLDEDRSAPDSADLLTGEAYSMTPAPPDSVITTAKALVSKDYRQNPVRNLVLVPSAGSPLGSFDPAAGERGRTSGFLNWAFANDYAATVFSATALAEEPTTIWDGMLAGNYSRHIIVLVAHGALPLLISVLEPIHSMFYARCRSICIFGDDEVSADAAVNLISKAGSNKGAEIGPAALAEHLGRTLVQLPSDWTNLDDYDMKHEFFKMLADREDKWASAEGDKLAGLQAMTDNDLTGLKRIGINRRVERVSRDRATDELSVVLDSNLQKHRGENGSTKAPPTKTTGGLLDDEPGVD